MMGKERMPGYVFVENSNKPTQEEARKRTPVVLDNVSIPCIIAASEMGYRVFMGVNKYHPEELPCNYNVELYDSHTYRSITAFRDNRIAFHNLDQLVRNNGVEVIHCNTPVGGIIGRLVGKKNKVKKVIYTAHGFHFYKGAPLINRTVFKLAEYIMARWTDAIITMNSEDYEAAKRFKLRKGGKVYIVHGVGIDLNNYINVDKTREIKRKELGFSQEDIIIISAGDLIKRKNYEVAIRSVAKSNFKYLHYLICGRGPEENNLKELAKTLGVDNQVHFLGFRSDVKDLMGASDIFLFTSLQEGMPRSLMEAMACGLPCVVSQIRGNVDLITDRKNGFLCKPDDVDAFAKSIYELCSDRELRHEMGKENLEDIKQYDVKVVCNEIKSIYSEVLD